MMMKTYLRAGFGATALLLLAGCASVNTQHPQVVTDAELAGKDVAKVTEYANVYFIRPKMFKSKGVADKAVRIEFLGKPMLKMGEGSYTLLRIKPSKGQLKVFSQTKFTNEPVPIEVWRAREYKFIEGKTYFIHIRQVNEEFRGVFYDPEPVSLGQAKKLLENARASGAARSAPIDELAEVDEPPASATEGVSPALPENVYKHEKYLRKVQ
jgi:hypothetical protein